MRDNIVAPSLLLQVVIVTLPQFQTLMLSFQFCYRIPQFSATTRTVSVN